MMTTKGMDIGYKGSLSLSLFFCSVYARIDVITMAFSFLSPLSLEARLRERKKEDKQNQK